MHTRHDLLIIDDLHIREAGSKLLPETRELLRVALRAMQDGVMDPVLGPSVGKEGIVKVLLGPSVGKEDIVKVLLGGTRGTHARLIVALVKGALDREIVWENGRYRKKNDRCWRCF